MFRLALVRCPGVALLLLGMTVCVCPLSPDDESARIEGWIKALENKNPDVREAAAVALQKQGVKAKAALPALKKALKDEDANVRSAASRALLEIDEAISYADLLRRLNDRKLPVAERRKVCRELSRNSYDNESTVTALETVLSDPDVQDLAAAASKYLRARRAVGPALVRTIKGGGRMDLGGQVVFSPDGDTFACTGHPEVKLWDTLTGKQVAAFKGHTIFVHCVSFSPDGKTLASGSGNRLQDQGEIKLWDVQTGKERATLKGHKWWVQSMSFSPDGKVLASAGHDDVKVRLWDVATGQKRDTLAGDTEDTKYAASVCFSPDGKTLAIAHGSWWALTVTLWDAATRQKLAILKGHATAVTSVCFSPSGKTLASASADSTRPANKPAEVILWDVATRKPLVTLKWPPANIHVVAFSPDGKTLASAGGVRGSRKQGEIKLIDARTGQVLATLPDADAAVRSVAFSPDGKLLASVNDDGTIRLWATEGLLSRVRKKLE